MGTQLIPVTVYWHSVHPIRNSVVNLYETKSLEVTLWQVVIYMDQCLWGDFIVAEMSFARIFCGKTTLVVCSM